MTSETEKNVSCPGYTSLHGCRLTRAVFRILGLRSGRSTGGSTRSSSTRLTGAVGLLRPVETVLWRRGSILPCFPGPVPHNFGVDCTGHAVVQLGVHLWESIAGIHASLGNIPDGSSLYNIPDDELPDGLILRASLQQIQVT